MLQAASRRDFLGALVGGVAGAALCPAGSGRVFAQANAHALPIAATRLGGTLTLVTGSGGNIVVHEEPGGLVLVNGGRPERAHDLIRFLNAQWPGRPVRTLFNTDWHPEHTGANEALGSAGATIIAHVHTRDYLRARHFVDWQDRTYPPSPAPALPTETFRTTGRLDAGAETIGYGHLGQAHTDGDIYVRFPEANVLVAGDVLTVGTYPIADYTTGGWIGGLRDATQTLVDLADAGTIVVPGVGPVQTRADLEAQHEMLATLRDRLREMMREGLGAEDMLAAGATREFDGRWGDPELFLSTAYRGLWLHVRELGGIV